MEFLKVIVGIGVLAVVFCFFQGCSTMKPIQGSRSYYLKGNKIIFSREGSTIIRGATEVKGADVNSFKPLSDYYAKDKNYVYWRAYIIPNADVNSIELLKVYDDSSWYYSSTYIKDKNYVFYETTIVKDADPKTFVPIDTTSGEDRNYMFDRDMIEYKKYKNDKE